MPTYEYQCDACRHGFEKFHSMKDAPIKKCPKCGKLKVRRLLGTGGGIIFKGSGFYQTDYRSSGYTEKAKQDSGSQPDRQAGGSKPESCAKPDGGSKPSDSSSKKKTK